MTEELSLSIDPIAGDCTRRTCFSPGADTSRFGGKTRPSPEEVFIVSVRLYDHTCHVMSDLRRAITQVIRLMSLIPHSSKPGVGYVVLEVTFSNRTIDNNGV